MFIKLKPTLQIICIIIIYWVKLRAMGKVVGGKEEEWLQYLFWHIWLLF